MAEMRARFGGPSKRDVRHPLSGDPIIIEVEGGGVSAVYFPIEVCSAVVVLDRDSNPRATIGATELEWPETLTYSGDIEDRIDGLTKCHKCDLVIGLGEAQYAYDQPDDPLCHSCFDRLPDEDGGGDEGGETTAIGMSLEERGDR
jgi:hypothetical protein